MIYLIILGGCVHEQEAKTNLDGNLVVAVYGLSLAGRCSDR